MTKKTLKYIKYLCFREKRQSKDNEAHMNWNVYNPCFSRNCLNCNLPSLKAITVNMFSTFENKLNWRFKINYTVIRRY